ncbi:uncharacterized protein LOC131219266 [Magnolia sinica]|uniref:uncharacterized protein LOC131219266 n=1 Tax=Magnolia sinica TaxID=86752 RepID=UPI00265AC586|nr:uncharacterized protein LOC131219266 [Magnolia sinica]
MDFRWSETQQQQQQQQQTQSTTATDPYTAAAQFYNAQQHAYAQYPYYPHAQNPIPSQSNPKHQTPSAQFDSASSEAGLRPPGIDHYTPNPYLPHGGYDGQAALQYAHPQMMQASAYFPDPSMQQSWAAQEAFQQSGVDPATYAATVGLANGMVGPNPNPMWNNSTGRHFAKGAMKKAPKKIKVVQSAWCEICKIECNSKDVLDKHKMGKKHKKSLEKLEAKKEAVAAAAKPKNPVAAKKETPSGEVGNAAGGQATRRKGAPTEVEDLETKRRKLMESGAAPDSLRVCAICNVAVNSETVFNYHLAGQKHAAQLKKHAATAAGAATTVAGPQAVTAA